MLNVVASGTTRPSPSSAKVIDRGTNDRRAKNRLDTRGWVCRALHPDVHTKIFADAADDLLR